VLAAAPGIAEAASAMVADWPVEPIIVRSEAARYGARFASYCRVRPGITGLWQVSGRNDISYRRRVAMDAVYARTKCLSWDVKILLLTIPAVFLARGSY